MKSAISLLVLAATVALADPPEAIQRVTLDERAVVTVPVATNRVTTISFPGTTTAIDAVGVTADGKTPGQFQLAADRPTIHVFATAMDAAMLVPMPIPEITAAEDAPRCRRDCCQVDLP